MTNHNLARGLAIYREALEGLEQRWTPAFDQLLEQLKSARGGYFFTGIGKSGHVASRLASTWRSLGIPAHFLHGAEAFHGDLGMLQPDDILFIISKSGSGTETLELARWARGNDIVTIAFTGNPHAPLLNLCAFKLDCSVQREADPWNLAPSTSTIVAEIAGELLGFSLAEHRQFGKPDFARLHPGGQLGRNLRMFVHEVMHEPVRVELQTSLKIVLERMTENNLGAACVTENDQLLGIITDGDIRRFLLKNIPVESQTAADVMTRKPVTVDAGARLAEALEIMENRPSRLMVLPVVDTQNKLLGLIRLHDIYG